MFKKYRVKFFSVSEQNEETIYKQVGGEVTFLHFKNSKMSLLSRAYLNGTQEQRDCMAVEITEVN